MKPVNKQISNKFNKLEVDRLDNTVYSKEINFFNQLMHTIDMTEILRAPNRTYEEEFNKTPTKERGNNMT